ncbi:MAG TPA: glutamine--fructose-6-phosphate aminotransferase, partial [Methylophilus sp.]|nr:glutamine--fructose-6-phosphate aminotransferase [Methylophilus sp.]
MCGIVGAVSNRNIVPLLIEGLSRLEYRGYDSAGIAVLNQTIERARAVGRVAELQLKAQGMHSHVGIGHTRWATHGGVTEQNAHPHVSPGQDQAQIAVVHNGIIENHDEQRDRLKGLGYQFYSQTDTEVIAHLVHYYYQQSHDLFTAVKQAIAELTGAYAISVIALEHPQQMVVARLGCPLLIGLGDGENFVASDVSAVLSATRKVIYLEDGDVATLQTDAVVIVDKRGE